MFKVSLARLHSKTTSAMLHSKTPIHILYYAQKIYHHLLPSINLYTKVSPVDIPTKTLGYINTS